MNPPAEPARSRARSAWTAADDAATHVTSSTEQLRADVLRGLAEKPRKLPPKYFYDARGADLFEQICELPEYYPTRTETRILEQYAPDMAAALGPRARIIEFGSGSGIKTRILLRHLEDPASYIPVDISAGQLHRFAGELRQEFPSLRVEPVAGDYTGSIPLPPPPPGARRTVAFFPGSTIGNFEEADAVAFLRHVRSLCGPGGALLIGADLHKDIGILEPAYNDASGVTAEFNLNVLRRINRECGADFPLDAFAHHAPYDTSRMRIEMRLVCTQRCIVNVPVDAGGTDTATFGFRPGDHIVTEYSHKYTPDSFRSLARRSGWTAQRAWTDDDDLFSVWLLT
jgi:dimethylhistidine N-methyltransferase